MIRGCKHVQCRKRAQTLDHRPDQRQISQRISRTLEKQHCNSDLGQMSGAIIGRSIRRMQWKAQEYQATNARQRRLPLCLRSHATAEGFASGNQHKLRCKPGCREHGRADCRVA